MKSLPRRSSAQFRNRARRLSALALLVFATSAPTLAGDDFELERTTVDGGGVSSAGRFQLRATVGPPRKCWVSRFGPSVRAAEPSNAPPTHSVKSSSSSRQDSKSFCRYVPKTPTRFSGM